MKILVIGRCAREHSLCWRLHQSQNVWGLFSAGGNPGIDQLAKPSGVAPDDIGGLIRFVKDSKIDLTIVRPEEPLESRATRTPLTRS